MKTYLFALVIGTNWIKFILKCFKLRLRLLEGQLLILGEQEICAPLLSVEAPVDSLVLEGSVGVANETSRGQEPMAFLALDTSGTRARVQIIPHQPFTLSEAGVIDA